AALPRSRDRARPSRGRAALRHTEARGDGAGAGGPPAAVAPRRARGWSQSRRGGRARQAHPDHPSRARAHRPSRGAPHQPGHAGLRPCRRARLRAQDRGGIACRHPAEPRRDPRIPRARRLMPALLAVENLEAQYGWTTVLRGMSFDVEEGGITTILGANGAGKTTTLRAVTSMVKTSGSVRFAGISIQGKATEEIVRLGIAHAPEGRGTFVQLTVEENLRLGAYVRRDRARLVEDFDRVYSYFPVLGQRRGQVAGTLSGGEQQMLAVARALMLRPRLLLLD